MRYVCFYISLFLFTACVKKEKENFGFKQIQIQSYPSFMTPSEMMLNMNDSSVIFTRIGIKEFSDFRQFPDTITKIVAPTSFKFKLADSVYRKIQTISFHKEDLVDRTIDCDDGIFTNILFDRNNDEIVDVEIKNAITDNQNVLILELLNGAQKNAPDSLTLHYLIGLKSYY